MAVVAVDARYPRHGRGLLKFEDYVAAALTAAANKKEWVCPVDGRIVQVIVTSQAAGTGGTSTIIDVHKNGTTVFTTQTNRPELALADSGAYANGKRVENDVVRAGDLLSYDVDQITTTGPTRTTVTIIVQPM